MSMQTAVICLQKTVELSSEKEGHHSFDRNVTHWAGNLVEDHVWKSVLRHDGAVQENPKMDEACTINGR